MVRPARAVYLSHEAVRPGVLLVLEDDVRVVVGGELLEALRAARDLALVSSARAQRLLGHVWYELLVRERRQLLGMSPPPVAPSRSAARAGRREPQTHQDHQQHSAQHEHRVRGSVML